MGSPITQQRFCMQTREQKHDSRHRNAPLAKDERPGALYDIKPVGT
jgi:hypothetical protein